MGILDHVLTNSILDSAALEVEAMIRRYPRLYAGFLSPVAVMFLLQFVYLWTSSGHQQCTSLRRRMICTLRAIK